MSDSDSPPQCPLCISDFNETEKKFYPCPCGYQICCFCFDRIITSTNLCPSCRRRYDDDAGHRIGQDFLPNKVKMDNAAKSPAASVCYLAPKMVQITGIPVRLMNTGLLRRREYLGQYGDILKLVVSRSLYPSGHLIIQSQDQSVFVKFRTRDAARACVCALDGCEFQGAVLQASVCVAERCHSVLAGAPCSDRRNCLRIHREIRDADVRVKHADMEKRNAALRRSVNEPKPGSYDGCAKIAQSRTVLPPPRLIPPKGYPFAHAALYGSERRTLLELALAEGPLTPPPPPAHR